MTPALTEPLTYTYFNDSIRVVFVLPSTEGSSYTLSAQLAGTTTDITGSPATITAQLFANARRSIVSGTGLCSGSAGETVSFDLHVKDQMGNAFTGNVPVRVSFDLENQLCIIAFS
jgi:hypothetical protein